MAAETGVVWGAEVPQQHGSCSRCRRKMAGCPLVLAKASTRVDEVASMASNGRVIEIPDGHAARESRDDGEMRLLSRIFSP